MTTSGSRFSSFSKVLLTVYLTYLDLFTFFGLMPASYYQVLISRIFQIANAEVETKQGTRHAIAIACALSVRMNGFGVTETKSIQS